VFSGPVKKLPALIAAAGVSAALAIPALAASTKTDKVTDRGFSPASVSIKKGDSVKWLWSGKKRHQVFQVGGPGHFHSPAHTGSGKFKHRFTKKGTYKFVDPYSSKYMTVKVK
jgi:plastocyanin